MIRTIYEDEAILVVNKPTGIESEQVARQFNFPIVRHGLIHRLDKETSGVMVLAKTDQTLRSLKEQFQKHQVEKDYTALVLGEMQPKQGRVVVQLARDPKRKQAIKVIPFSVDQERGKLREAVTEWQTTENQELRIKNQGLTKPLTLELPAGEAGSSPLILTLVKVYIRTGRTHQIRATLHYLGFPILGDPMYNTKQSRIVSKMLGLNRQFLHAIRLKFQHPSRGIPVEFRSELPKELKKSLFLIHDSSNFRPHRRR